MKKPLLLKQSGLIRTYVLIKNRVNEGTEVFIMTVFDYVYPVSQSFIKVMAYN